MWLALFKIGGKFAPLIGVRDEDTEKKQYEANGAK